MKRDAECYRKMEECLVSFDGVLLLKESSRDGQIGGIKSRVRIGAIWWNFGLKFNNFCTMER